MSTQSIPREEWGKFLEDYSRSHAGWLVGLDVVDQKDATKHPTSAYLRLERIAPDRIRSGDFAIVVKLGGKPGEHIIESVYHPVDIAMESGADGTPATLRIDSADGLTTFVRLIGSEPGESGNISS